MADVLNPMPGMEVAVDADMPSAKVEITVQGEGGYYTPHISESGELNWTPSSSDMPAVEAANVRGPQGLQGKTGETGPTGPAGADGYTPVKGVDYYTDADKDEIVQAVMSALPAAEGVSY